MKLNEESIVTKETLLPYIAEIIKYYRQQGVKIDPLPKLVLIRNQSNADMPLGKTGFYEPSKQLIALYIVDRHLKDVLRSFAHELIHHNQYIQYGAKEVDTENVNKSKLLNKLEADAYLRGNMLFRSWSDSYRGTK